MNLMTIGLLLMFYAIKEKNVWFGLSVLAGSSGCACQTVIQRYRPCKCGLKLLFSLGKFISISDTSDKS